MSPISTASAPAKPGAVMDILHDALQGRYPWCSLLVQLSQADPPSAAGTGPPPAVSQPKRSNKASVGFFSFLKPSKTSPTTATSWSNWVEELYRLNCCLPGLELLHSASHPEPVPPADWVAELYRLHSHLPGLVLLQAATHQEHECGAASSNWVEELHRLGPHLPGLELLQSAVQPERAASSNWVEELHRLGPHLPGLELLQSAAQPETAADAAAASSDWVEELYRLSPHLPGLELLQSAAQPQIMNWVEELYQLGHHLPGLDLLQSATHPRGCPAPPAALPALGALLDASAGGGGAAAAWLAALAVAGQRPPAAAPPARPAARPSPTTPTVSPAEQGWPGLCLLGLAIHSVPGPFPLCAAVMELTAGPPIVYARGIKKRGREGGGGAPGAALAALAGGPAALPYCAALLAVGPAAQDKPAEVDGLRWLAVLSHEPALAECVPLRSLLVVAGLAARRHQGAALLARALRRLPGSCPMCEAVVRLEAAECAAETTRTAAVVSTSAPPAAAASSRAASGSAATADAGLRWLQRVADGPGPQPALHALLVTAGLAVRRRHGTALLCGALQRLPQRLQMCEAIIRLASHPSSSPAEAFPVASAVATAPAAAADVGLRWLQRVAGGAESQPALHALLVTSGLAVRRNHGMALLQRALQRLPTAFPLCEAVVRLGFTGAVAPPAEAAASAACTAAGSVESGDRGLRWLQQVADGAEPQPALHALLVTAGLTVRRHHGLSLLHTALQRLPPPPPPLRMCRAVVRLAAGAPPRRPATGDENKAAPARCSTPRPSDATLLALPWLEALRRERPPADAPALRALLVVAGLAVRRHHGHALLHAALGRLPGCRLAMCEAVVRLRGREPATAADEPCGGEAPAGCSAPSPGTTLPTEAFPALPWLESLRREEAERGTERPALRALLVTGGVALRRHHGLGLLHSSVRRLPQRFVMCEAVVRLAQPKPATSSAPQPVAPSHSSVVQPAPQPAPPGRAPLVASAEVPAAAAADTSPAKASRPPDEPPAAVVASDLLAAEPEAEAADLEAPTLFPQATSLIDIEMHFPVTVTAAEPPAATPGLKAETDTRRLSARSDLEEALFPQPQATSLVEMAFPVTITTGPDDDEPFMDREESSDAFAVHPAPPDVDPALPVPESSPPPASPATAGDRPLRGTALTGASFRADRTVILAPVPGSRDLSRAGSLSNVAAPGLDPDATEYEVHLRQACGGGAVVTPSGGHSRALARLRELQRDEPSSPPFYRSPHGSGSSLRSTGSHTRCHHLEPLSPTQLGQRPPDAAAAVPAGHASPVRSPPLPLRAPAPGAPGLSPSAGMDLSPPRLVSRFSKVLSKALHLSPQRLVETASPKSPALVNTASPPTSSSSSVRPWRDSFTSPSKTVVTSPTTSVNGGFQPNVDRILRPGLSSSAAEDSAIQERPAKTPVQCAWNGSVSSGQSQMEKFWSGKPANVPPRGQEDLMLQSLSMSMSVMRDFKPGFQSPSLSSTQQRGRLAPMH